MKIICIGRNYADHAKELGNALPSEPLFFCKPDSAILAKGNPFFIPDWSDDIHYEIEILFKINRLGKYIQQEHALKYISEIGIGIDFTARDVQEELKKKGLPWEKAKGFDGSAVIAEKWLPVEEMNLSDLKFGLKKNGEWVQQGNTKDMIFRIEQLIEHVSQYMTLKIGDIIFSGTPQGVGPVKSGDVLEGYIQDTPFFELKIK
jgi:acylpyruvate hydrolase